MFKNTVRRVSKAETWPLPTIQFDMSTSIKDTKRYKGHTDTGRRIVRTPNMNNFPRTTTEAAPERGGGTHELGDSATRDHVRDWRSAGARGEGNRAVGPAASSSSIIIFPS